MASLEYKLELDVSLVVPLVDLIRAQKNLGAALVDLCSANNIPPPTEISKLSDELALAEAKACAAVHRLEERAEAIRRQTTTEH